MFSWSQKRISLRYPCPRGRVISIFVVSLLLIALLFYLLLLSPYLLLFYLYNLLFVRWCFFSYKLIRTSWNTRKNIKNNSLVLINSIQSINQNTLCFIHLMPFPIFKKDYFEPLSTRGWGGGGLSRPQWFDHKKNTSSLIFYWLDDDRPCLKNKCAMLFLCEYGSF